LRCAEGLLAAGNAKRAATLYNSLLVSNCPNQVRAAAWHGLVLAAPSQRVKLFRDALAGKDGTLRLAALKSLRELSDPSLTKSCLRQWSTLPPDSQLAVLDAALKLDSDGPSAARIATQSPYLPVRVAAWQALGDVGGPAAVSGLATAAVCADSAEREAARDALARIRGPGVREAFLASLATAEPQVKAELLQALGQRLDAEAASVMLQNAASGPEVVRLAALEALKKVAVENTIGPLLEIAAGSKSDRECEAVLTTLYAVCQASADKEKSTSTAIEVMGRFSAAERRRVLPALAELGTPRALRAADSASREGDPESVKAAIRVLSHWPNATAAPRLLELARTGGESAPTVLALRGYIQVAGQESDPAKRLALLQAAIATAKRPEEKKQVLGQLGQIPTPDALRLVMNSLGDPDLTNEAALAAVTLAEKLAKANPKLASETAAAVLAKSKTPEVVKRAWALGGRLTADAPFIQDWLVCGPFTRVGITSALAAFNTVFPPERPAGKPEWKAMPRGHVAGLSEVFPGRMNCAAYLRTRISAPQECDAVLLVGSDDGVKTWLNGAVVHSNNVDRGLVIDQDAVPIHLKQGTNDLMLKITQGGGGWAACARIVGFDGQPVPGLRVEPLGDAAPHAAVPAPAAPVAAKPSVLPQRDAFKTLRLSDQFYAEGACYADFNRDGKLDIVAGPFWFEGPDFQKRHEYRPVKTFDPTEYSDNFLTYTGDFNGDGWPDILCVPFPGKEGYWFENPAGRGQPWKQHVAYTNIGNESPVWGDVNGDGRPELIFCNDGYLGYAGPDPANPEQPWVFHPISNKDKRYQKFTHGTGYGDINGDNRVDIAEAAGWWEQPADPKPGQLWIFHPFHFADSAAQMLVSDVDGDGLSDIITAWHCHLYGMVWWQQVRTAEGKADWKQHVIFSPSPDVSTPDFRVSQMHALELKDMNGDGLKDILTGKRFWAHGPKGDVEPDAPAVVFWLERRPGRQGKVAFIPHLIDDDSGVGTQVSASDLNQDGRPDVIVANKKGIFVHLSQGTK
jgi:HEAT repeat protein